MSVFSFYPVATWKNEKCEAKLQKGVAGPSYFIFPRLVLWGPMPTLSIPTAWKRGRAAVCVCVCVCVCSPLSGN
jgi:hypothetical protein